MREATPRPVQAFAVKADSGPLSRQIQRFPRELICAMLLSWVPDVCDRRHALTVGGQERVVPLGKAGQLERRAEPAFQAGSRLT